MTPCFSHRSIEDSPKAPGNVPKRLTLLQDHFTLFLYTNVCRSLFEKDTLLFAFSLAARLAIAEGKLEPKLLRFLVTGELQLGGGKFKRTRLNVSARRI